MILRWRLANRRFEKLENSPTHNVICEELRNSPADVARNRDFFFPRPLVEYFSSRSRAIRLVQIMRKMEVKLLCYCSLVTTGCLALILPLSEKFFVIHYEDKTYILTLFKNFFFPRSQIILSEIKRKDYAGHPVWNSQSRKGKIFFFFFLLLRISNHRDNDNLRANNKSTILVLKYTASYVTNVWMYENGECVVEQYGRLSSRYDDQCRRKPMLLGRDVSWRSLRHVVIAVPPTIVCTWELYMYMCACMYACVCVYLVCGYAHTHCAQVIEAYWTRLDAHMTKWSSTRRGRAEKSRRTWLAGLIAKGKIFPGILESRAELILLIMVVPTTYMNRLQRDEEPHPRTSFMHIYIHQAK